LHSMMHHRGQIYY